MTPRAPRRPPGFPAGAGTSSAPAPAAARPAEPLRPQRLLDSAARDAARLTAPTGLGLDSGAVRQRMVERLRLEGIACEPVFEAMAQVPRHLFVDTALAGQAYEDTSLPIGLGQTISKPSVVARMLELLFQGANARRQQHLGQVLEIGTGCGYQAALLARLGRRVVSVERLAGLLHRQALARLTEWRSERQLHLPVRLIHDDGSRPHGLSGPFDSIVSAAGGDAVPPAWLALLAPGGRLVAPVGGDGLQALEVVDVQAGPQGPIFNRQRLEGVAFVPLRSGIA
jgi:protein-L-isoaspartate(D-aspartate) O-methyltransferase